MINDDIDQFKKSSRNVVDALNDIANGKGNTQSAAFNINAGGAAAWVQTMLSGMVFTSLIVSIMVGSSWISDRFARLDSEIVALKAENAENKVFLQDIWRQAPYLKPKEK